MIDFNKPSEGIDYQIVPLKVADGDQLIDGWAVEIISTPFRPVKIAYNGVKYDGATQRITYKYYAWDKEFDELSDEAAAFNDFVYEVLLDIIKNGIANGSVVLDDKDSSD